MQDIYSPYAGHMQLVEAKLLKTSCGGEIIKNVLRRILTKHESLLPLVFQRLGDS